ncbi:MAG: hypothetical protein Q7S50_03765 [bacterium]|nr:hypothetical protein [bacterium]
MQNSYRIYLIGGVVLVVLAAAGFWLFKTSVPASQMTSTSSATTTGGVSTSTPQVSAAQSLLLDRAIPATSPNLTAQARAIALSNLTKATENVRKNTFSYGDWIQIGVLRQMLGDYEGAGMIWRYLVAEGTLDAGTKATAYGNLGNLYALHLKDYSRAEANYKAAIDLNSQNPDYYRSLHELYRYTLKNASAAEDILRKGIKNIPQALDLQVLLARYLKDIGKTAEAKTAYDAAMAAFEAQGNTVVRDELRAERDAL